MPPRPTRRTATRVKDGRVQKKHNHARTATPDALDRSVIPIERWGPGEGFRHLLTVSHVRAFLEMLPDWDEIARGVRWVVLDGGWDAMGWYERGTVAVCAWEKELWWRDTTRGFFDDHREVIERLGVEWSPARGGDVEVRWTAEQARGFQLLHVLTHELGHHHDRMTTHDKRDTARGEPYAEAYAHRVMDEVFDDYVARFGI